MGQAAELFEALWRGTALHLWQSSLVLAVLGLLSLSLRTPRWRGSRRNREVSSFTR